MGHTWSRRQCRWITGFAAWAAFMTSLVGTGAGAAHAHPLSQGALDVVVHPDRVDVRARVTMEEVAVTDMLTAPPEDAAGAAGGGGAAAILERHARYLAAHVHVSADGKPLLGGVVRVVDPAATRPGGQPAGAPDQETVEYELAYRPPAGGEQIGPAARIELRQDVLTDVEFAPGVSWEASYFVRIGAPAGEPTEALLTSVQPILYINQSPAPGWWPLFLDYAWHGVHHILSGYDHLLFIAALVLAAVSLWDLVKVVSVFTLAHTITLLLSALDVVRMPEWIVEPMIAGSIVFVAAQNVLWPAQSRGWIRLAAAFFFGLFHGLGYAGGVLEAMDGMGGRTMLLAILAFSIGVEVGHQLFVLPLFALLKLARGATVPAPDPTPAPAEARLAARDRFSLLTLRYGSAVICLAGLYYFVAAVHAGWVSSGAATS